MTREEAIKVLRTESVELGGNAVSVCRFLEALDMAISALRQQDVPDKDVGKMTNAQKIRAMNDEELADFLNQWGTSTRAWQKDPGETLYWLQQTAGEEDKRENLD